MTAFGLTTAASVWSVAGIGLAVGGGLFIPAVAATVIILIILAGIKPLERRFIGVRQRRELLILAERDALSLATLNSALGAGSAGVTQFVLRQESAEIDEITIALSRVSPVQFLAICKRLEHVPGVKEVKETESAS